MDITVRAIMGMADIQIPGSARVSISINTRRGKRGLVANDSEYGSFYATNSSSRFVIALNIPKKEGQNENFNTEN